MWTKNEKHRCHRRPDKSRLRANDATARFHVGPLIRRPDRKSLPGRILE